MDLSLTRLLAEMGFDRRLLDGPVSCEDRVLAVQAWLGGGRLVAHVLKH